MAKTIDEINDVLHDTTVEFDLEFIARVMKVLELAEDNIDNREVSDLVIGYANTLQHEIMPHLSEDEFMDAEDKGLVDIW